MNEYQGEYSGRRNPPTHTEEESGQLVFETEPPAKPPRRGGKQHRILAVYGDWERRTAYDASFEECGDFHAMRRESTRLLVRGYLVKDGVLPNRARGGREHVDAYRITIAGFDALRELNGGTP